MVKEKPETHVSEEKKVLVKQLAGEMKNKNTVMLASIKGLPAAQFQKIKKALKNVDVRVVKKRALLRAIDTSGKENIKRLKDYAKEDIALLISDIDAFELAEALAKNTSPVKAKAGQEAPADIKVEAGPTGLPAGPAVSELGAVGLIIQIKGGKIEVVQSKVLVKKGEAIREEMAGVMSKLNMTPFSVGFSPLIAYDAKTDGLFTELTIDKEGVLDEMKSIFAKTRAFAVNIVYINGETIAFLLAKAASHEKAIGSLLKEPANTPNEETKPEEAK